MGQKLEVKVGSRRLRVQVGNHSEGALNAAADRANEVLGRLLAASKGSRDGGPNRFFPRLIPGNGISEGEPFHRDEEPSHAEEKSGGEDESGQELKRTPFAVAEWLPA